MNSTDESDKRRVLLYDTTLRDGMAREGIDVSARDKVRIAKRLDRYGVHFIEGGYAGSNPKDAEFFRRMADVELNYARLVAFGSTRRKEKAVESDRGVRAVLDAGTQTICIFGKTSDFQVRVALETSLDENLAMIADTVSYLVAQGREVVYDAEHFFDGYASDPGYAIQTLQAARDAGAAYLVLCDTNGGTLPARIDEVTRTLVERGFPRLGIHTHNDVGCAVAGSLAAIEAGCEMVQGTINGYGERTGNADLCAIVPTLELKMGLLALPEGHLKQTTEVSHFVSETANQHHNAYQPYVGRSAFAHKGGAHGSAVRRDAATYEHVDPGSVGNTRKLVVSEIAGRAMILDKLEELGIEMPAPKLSQLLETVKDLAYQGYTFEAADASLELLILKKAGLLKPRVELESYHVHLHRRSEHEAMVDATIKFRVGGERFIAASEGNGPVHALDQALRSVLEPRIEGLSRIRLEDYKVRVLEGHDDTNSVTRVLVETGDGTTSWGTIGVNVNIIKASWDALHDGIEYGLYLLDKAGRPAE